MGEIKGPTEAEVRAREFIRDRHPRVRQIFLGECIGKGMSGWWMEKCGLSGHIFSPPGDLSGSR